MRTLKCIFVPIIAIALFLSSCKKETTTATPPANNNNPTNPAGPQPQTPMPTGGDISGALISIQMKYTTQPTGSPMPVDVNSEMGLAVFYSSPGGTTKAEAGTVSVNDVDLEKQSDNSYLKLAHLGGTPADLDFDNTSDWNITGGSGVSALSHNHNASFPEYTGEVPSSITKSSGVTLNFTGSTLSNADSVYVVIASGSASVIKSYAANAGSVSISASELNGLPAVSDNSAVFQVCPFSYETATKNGKKYVFIKEQAVVRAVNIN